MAKKQENKEDNPKKGKVRLVRKDAAGGYIDVDPEHAERILALEKSIGVNIHEIETSSGSDKETI